MKIRILAKEYNLSVASVCAKLEGELVRYDVYLSQSNQDMSKVLAASADCDALILIGDPSAMCSTFAETFGLALVYDKFAEKNVLEYCARNGLSAPAQYTMDKCCMLPESFNHFTSVFAMQCGCSGVVGKCHVYILPDDKKECELMFENYVVSGLFRSRSVTTHCFKIFGLSQKDLDDRLAKLAAKYVTIKSETVNLDSKVNLIFSKSCAKKVVSEYLVNFFNAFQGYVYADSDKTLPQCVVALLNERYKTVATAESITGGLIASSIVGVPGASNVLYEGAVTYTIDSKCSRLGLNPHFIDEHGVVSSQVAKEMALSQLQHADYSVATTGFAGPTADNGLPVGLCFIAVGAKSAGKNYVKVFKNVFSGDRNSIRAQVANTAMFLLTNAISNSQFFSSKRK